MDIYRLGESKYLKVSWDEVEELVENLAGKIVSSYRFDLLVGVLRGGMIVAHLLSDILGIDEIYPVGCSSYTDIYKHSQVRVYHPLIIDSLEDKSLLVVDDVADSGETLKTIVQKVIAPKHPREYRTATLHIKPWSTFKPDYYVDVVDAWIVYPWEKYEMIKLLSPRFIQFLGEEDGLSMLGELVGKDTSKIKRFLLTLSSST